VWILRGFDRVSERQVERFDLAHVTDHDVRRMLSIAPGEEVIGGWDVPPSAMPELERILGQPLRSDLDYQISPVRRA
jgi:hypothetical protein